MKGSRIRTSTHVAIGKRRNQRLFSKTRTLVNAKPTKVFDILVVQASDRDTARVEQVHVAFVPEGFALLHLRRRIGIEKKGASSSEAVQGDGMKQRNNRYQLADKVPFAQ